MQAASHEPAEDDASAGADGLTARELEILEFESHWVRHVGAKEAAIRDRFSLSPARYYQLLGALVDSPLALAHDPMLIKRLQRARDARLTARGASASRLDG